MASLGYMERHCLKTNTQTKSPRKMGAVQDSKHNLDLYKNIRLNGEFHLSKVRAS